MNPTDVVDRVAVGGTAGLIAGLVFALFAVVTGFQTKWIVQGWLYKEKSAESKSWQVLAESMGDKMDRLTTLSENQQKQSDKLIERADRIEKSVQDRSDRNDRITEANAAKLDRILLALESQQRRTTR